MKRKLINIFSIFIILVLLLIVILADDFDLKSLYFSYDNTFVIKEVDTEDRKDSIIYNEVDVPRVNMMSNNNTVNNNNVTSNNNVISNNVNKWVWPTVSSYTVTNWFGSHHNALDIASGYGSHVYAANSGVVTMVMGGCITGNLSCNGRGGNYVVIRHNTGNYYTVYMHLKDIFVSGGQVVSSGEVIGTMGNTGNVVPVPSSSNPYAGTHLHFCLYIGEPFRGGYTINPMNVY